MAISDSVQFFALNEDIEHGKWFSTFVTHGWITTVRRYACVQSLCPICSLENVTRLCW